MEWKRSSRRQGTASGFTIIEMAVVIAVASIIAGIVVPDFIELAKADLGEQAAVRMATVATAARQFYHNEGLTPRGATPELQARPAFARWPGELNEGGEAPSECNNAGVDPATELLGGDFVDNETLVNPWGGPIHMGIDGGGGGGGPPFMGLLCFFCPMCPGCGAMANEDLKCRFLIATDVPSELENVVEAYMPGATCSNQRLNRRCPVNAGNPPAGTTRCCVGLPRPSVEAALEVMLLHAWCANPANSGDPDWLSVCGP